MAPWNNAEVFPMVRSKALIGVGLASVMVAAIAAQPALAWHPKGAIIKKVQNVTTNSVVADANSAGEAIAAKPGDTLKYTIEVSNNGDTAQDGSNDMASVKLTDTLPEGVELASNPSQRTIQEDLGTIAPKNKVTKEYTVKVTSQKDGQVIENKACFTGNSKANDNPQQGCDTANVKVSVPKTPEKPQTPTPTTPQQTTPKEETPETPKESLPQTGAESAIGAVAGTSVLGYATHLYIRSKQGIKNTLRSKR